MESRRRSVFKAVTWRVIGLLITVGTTWAITGQSTIAAAVGVVDTLIKIGSFYVHERAWNRVRFGRLDPPEFQI